MEVYGVSSFSLLILLNPTKTKAICIRLDDTPRLFGMGQELQQRWQGATVQNNLSKAGKSRPQHQF